MKKIVFSGIQPSQTPTIGNYIGAIKQWVLMQNKFDCMYCIVDLHAITKQKNPSLLKKSILDTIALFLAFGLNPDKSTIFIQSHVLEHCQLFWILNCFTSFGELNRMTQFKTQKNLLESIKTGFFNYPILMAADILLYQSSLIPVGKDQVQHLELVKKIAKRFNLIYGEIFTIPETIIPSIGGKIMSLLNPEHKMSKSDKNKNNIISLLDNPKIVEKKILKSITDSDHPPKIYYNLKKKAGVSNLLTILSSFSEKKISILEKEFLGKKYIFLKKKVAEEIIFFIKKLQKKYFIFRKDEKFLFKVVEKGAKKARLKAKVTLKKVQDAIGFF